MSDSLDLFLTVCSMLVLFFLLCLFTILYSYFRTLRILDANPSKIANASSGIMTIRGTVKKYSELIPSPLSGTLCCGYSARSSFINAPSSRSNALPNTVSTIGINLMKNKGNIVKFNEFIVEDETGKCLVKVDSKNINFSLSPHHTILKQALPIGSNSQILDETLPEKEKKYLNQELLLKENDIVTIQGNFEVSNELKDQGICSVMIAISDNPIYIISGSTTQAKIRLNKNIGFMVVSISLAAIFFIACMIHAIRDPHFSLLRYLFFF